ncbi:hypothetical protein T08_616 [Trichinella sp. T8]|nr:hypothetical protein T08_616 [Trichinella sp. T8]
MNLAPGYLLCNSVLTCFPLTSLLNYAFPYSTQCRGTPHTSRYLYANALHSTYHYEIILLYTYQHNFSIYSPAPYVIILNYTCITCTIYVYAITLIYPLRLY